MYFDYEIGDIAFYEENAPVPRYLIVNFETAKLKKYLNLEDVPEADRQIFEGLEQS